MKLKSTNVLFKEKLAHLFRYWFSLHLLFFVLFKIVTDLDLIKISRILI